MPKAQLGNIELYYEQEGSGEPVLLAPASWWPSDAWNVSVVPFLSRRFKTIIFDCRGTGRSSAPRDGYAVGQFAQDCVGLLEHLGVARCHAVGFALGGQVVQAMAIERPDLVATLTIAAAGPGARTLGGGARIVSPDTEREIHDLGFERYIRAYIENAQFAFSSEFRQAHADVVSALADAVWRGQSTPQKFRLHEDARLTWDTLARAPEVKVPALILCGAEDDVSRRGSTPVDTAKRLAELIPGCELFLIPKVKHMTFWDGTGGLHALDDFLIRHPMRRIDGFHA
jgi:pimeloyl-ACP methyl ester carboxylesterase